MMITILYTSKHGATAKIARVINTYLDHTCTLMNLDELDMSVLEKTDTIVLGVPVYYGAEDISRFIPENTFIDYRKFDSLDELYLYLHSMDEIRYKEIISNINRYLQSDLYKSNFSIDSYVNRMADIIIGD